jgi:hypothetical protein
MRPSFFNRKVELKIESAKNPQRPKQNCYKKQNSGQNSGAGKVETMAL